MDVNRFIADTFFDPVIESNYGLISSLRYASPIHDHDFYELFLITHGSTLHNVNNQIQYLKEGALVFIRPHDVHFYSYDGDNDCQFINIPFSSKTINDVFGFLGKAFDPERLLTPQTPPVAQLSPFQKETFVERFENLQLIPQNNKPLINTLLRGLLVEVLTQHFLNTGNTIRNEYPLWFESLLTLMQKKDNFTVGLSRMYELSGRSICHLNRTFKQCLNITPTAFINNLRLDYARYLLITTRLSIIEIAMDSGFDNLSHFYHLFKRQFSIPPSELRNSSLPGSSK